MTSAVTMEPAQELSEEKTNQKNRFVLKSGWASPNHAFFLSVFYLKY